MTASVAVNVTQNIAQFNSDKLVEIRLHQTALVVQTLCSRPHLAHQCERCGL